MSALTRFVGAALGSTTSYAFLITWRPYNRVSPCHLKGNSATGYKKSVDCSRINLRADYLIVSICYQPR